MAARFRCLWIYMKPRWYTQITRWILWLIDVYWCFLWIWQDRSRVQWHILIYSDTIAAIAFLVGWTCINPSCFDLKWCFDPLPFYMFKYCFLFCFSSGHVECLETLFWWAQFTRVSLMILEYLTGWWFGAFFLFSWECFHPNWRTFFFQRGGSTTNH